MWYDKLLEERASGKRWMEAIHLASSWQAGMPLTRVEARFRRGVLRELATDATSPETPPARWFDDPWECLDRLQHLWAFYAGLPPETDVAPDMTHRGWMRLVVPDADDANRSRWRIAPYFARVVGVNSAFSQDCRKGLDWHARGSAAAPRVADRRDRSLHDHATVWVQGPYGQWARTRCYRGCVTG
jgi:hypothetical protein